MANTLYKCRQLLAPLEKTPFHPQWLVLRQRGPLASWVRRHARGLVLDVGCGNGWLRNHLETFAHYIGLDYPATIALGYTGTADLLADAAELPITSTSCDTVLLLDVIEHLPHPKHALNEVYRVLKPGGQCLIHVPFAYPLHDEPYDYRRLTCHGLERMAAAAGFQIVESIPSTQAIETAGALMAIALAKGMVDALQKRHWSILLAPFMIVLIPLINFLSHLSGFLFPKANFMPFSYRLTARKPAANTTVNH